MSTFHIFPPSFSTHHLVVFSNNIECCPGQPIGRERASLAELQNGANMPTIMFVLGMVVFLALSGNIFPVGGPRWQPVAARLRISPPQGQDYRIITNEQADVI